MLFITSSLTPPPSKSALEIDAYAWSLFCLLAMDGDRLEYLTQLAHFLRATYNFRNVTTRGDSNNSDLTLTPSVTFNAFYNTTYSVEFTIAWHPGYDVPCVFFQIYTSETEDDDLFDSKTLTFDQKALHFLMHTRQRHLLKSHSTSTSTGEPSSVLSSPSEVSVALFTGPTSTYFYIHPCQTAALAVGEVHDFRWLGFFLAALGIY